MTTVLALEYLRVLVWPCIVIFALMKYKGVIESLLSRSKVKITIAGVTIETTLQTVENSVEEILQGPLTPEQWGWLKRLRDKERLAYHHASDYEQLYPLRNAGLIRAHPKGFLTTAKEVEITALGRVLVQEAKLRGIA